MNSQLQALSAVPITNPSSSSLHFSLMRCRLPKSGSKSSLFFFLANRSGFICLHHSTNLRVQKISNGRRRQIHAETTAQCLGMRRQRRQRRQQRRRRQRWDKKLHGYCSNLAGNGMRTNLRKEITVERIKYMYIS
jgi:hypothetical protein